MGFMILAMIALLFFLLCFALSKSNSHRRNTFLADRSRGSSDRSDADDGGD